MRREDRELPVLAWVVITALTRKAVNADYLIKPSV